MSGSNTYKYTLSAGEWPSRDQALPNNPLGEIIYPDRPAIASARESMMAVVPAPYQSQFNIDGR